MKRLNLSYINVICVFVLSFAVMEYVNLLIGRVGGFPVLAGVLVSYSVMRYGSFARQNMACYMGIYILTWFIGTVVLFISKYSGWGNIKKLGPAQREVKMIMNIRQRLNKNYNELNGLYHDISMKLGLSDSESMVMYMLYDIQEPLTQSDIVKATGLSKQTLNSAIRKLEKEGIIILEKLNEKSKKIVMTDKGQVLIEQKMKPLVDMEDRVLASWTEEDRRKYLELIENFKVQFEKEVKAYDKRK